MVLVCVGWWVNHDGGGIGSFCTLFGEHTKAIHLMKIILQKVHTLSGFSQTPSPLSGLNPRVGRKSVLPPPLMGKSKISAIYFETYV